MTSVILFVLYFKIDNIYALNLDVRYNYLRHANIFLYFWIFLVTIVSILDLGLGIAFGLDYDTLKVG